MLTQQSGLVSSYGLLEGEVQTILFPNQGKIDQVDSTDGYDFYFFGFETDNSPDGIQATSVISYNSEEYQTKLQFLKEYDELIDQANIDLKAANDGQKELASLEIARSQIRSARTSTLQMPFVDEKKSPSLVVRPETEAQILEENRLIVAENER